MRVGDLVVETASPLVERVELRLVLCKRAIAATASLPGGLGVDLEEDGERAVAQLVLDRRRLHGPAAEGDHSRIRQAEGCDRVTLFLQAELGFSAALKEIGNRRAQILLEVPVEIDERTPETIRDLGPERRLAGAHEADEGEVTLQRVGCQSIRSR